jgi:hypothetical protein
MKFRRTAPRRWLIALSSSKGERHRRVRFHPTSYPFLKKAKSGSGYFGITLFLPIVAFFFVCVTGSVEMKTCGTFDKAGALSRAEPHEDAT